MQCTWIWITYIVRWVEYMDAWSKAYTSSPRLESEASKSWRDHQSYVVFGDFENQCSHQDLPRFFLLLVEEVLGGCRPLRVMASGPVNQSKGNLFAPLLMDTSVGGSRGLKKGKGAMDRQPRGQTNSYILLAQMTAADKARCRATCGCCPHHLDLAVWFDRV